jgi:hypothetical protein
MAQAQIFGWAGVVENLLTGLVSTLPWRALEGEGEEVALPLPPCHKFVTGFEHHSRRAILVQTPSNSAGP